MSSRIDVGEYSDRVGTTTTVDFGEVTRREVRRYARAVEDNNPLFHNLAHARSEGFDDLVVPPNYLPAIVTYDEGAPAVELREDGLDPNHYPIEVPPKAAMIGGGQTLTFERYVTAGEHVRVEDTFVDLFQKEGETRGTLTFLESEVNFLASDEKVIECEKTTIVTDRT